MTRTYEEVVKYWVSRKYDVPLEDIEKVNFDGSEGHYYSEYTWDYGRMNVSFKLKSSPYPRYIDLSEEDFPNIVNELVEEALRE